MHHILNPPRGLQMLSVSEPILGLDEKNALLEVIDSGWITMGERVVAFEQAFARAHGADDSIAVSSCTAGLHLILQALGIGSGDEVLVPGLTFVATANCVLYTGATPVFVDIASLDLPLMCLDDAAAKCTPRTRAVILVHYSGYLSARKDWRDFAAKRGLILIEDAAHAAGVQGVGTYGAAAAFSFYGNKNMTTAEGGVVITPDPGLRERIRQLRGHGLTSGTFQRHMSAPDYDVTMLGYNYRMDELRASLGLAQLSKLEAWNGKRKVLTQTYRALLSRNTPQVRVPFSESSAPSAYHIMPILLPDGMPRSRLILELRQAGIQTSVHYPPVHRFSLYKDKFPSVNLPKTEAFAAKELTLPLHPKLESGDVERITTSLAKSLAEV
jgi:dTDP-4-amino-4,6-dideoxygalactose transaminase